MTKQRPRPVKKTIPQGLSIPAMKKLIRRNKQEKRGGGKRTKGR